MKYKMIALILALTVVSWAQTATQAAPAAPSSPQQSTAPAEKAKCPCCDKMAAADTKGAPACCARHAQHSTGGKETASCCSGKDAKSCCSGTDAKSCMKSDKDKVACCAGCKDKTAAACCNGNCGKDCAKGCCSTANKSEKAASKCCNHDLRS